MSLNIYTLLEKTPNKVNNDIIKHLYDNGKTLDYDAGKIFIRDGSVSDTIFVVLNGEAEVVKQDNLNNVIVIATLEKGSIIGEMGMLLEQKRTASIRAKTDVKVLCVPNKVFMDALLRFPLLNIRLLKSLAARIQTLNEKFMDAVSARNLMMVGMHLLESNERTNGNEVTSELNILALAKETNIEITKVTAVLSTYENLRVLKDLKVTQGHATFRVDLSELRAYLKNCCV